MILKKVARYALLIFLLLIILLVLFQSTVFLFINNKFERYLQEQISIATEGKYALSVKTSINLFNRSITIESVNFYPIGICDSCENARYSLKADRIKLNGINILTYFKERSLVAKNMEFGNMSIDIFQGTTKYSKQSEDSIKNNFSVNHLLGPKFTSLTIENIDIKNAKIRVSKNVDTIHPVFSTSENFIRVKHFVINETAEQLNRLFLADSLNVKMKKFSYLMSDSLYTIVGKNLTSSYTDSVLTIDSLEFIPNYTKTKFGEKVGHQVSRLKISSSKVRFLKMNSKLFFEHNWFISNKLFLDDLVINVYRDKNIPFKKIPKPSLQQIIRKIPFFISIDSIFIENGNVIYEELAKDANKAGKLTFDNINAIITGLQNDTTLYTDKSILKLEAKCLLMGKGELNALFRFPLIDQKEVFYCSGKLNSMPMTAINPFLENTARASIKTGMIDYVHFDFKANEISSFGKMKFVYHDMELELLNKDNNNSSPKKKFFSFLIKKFVVNKSNPMEDESILITDIHFNRDPNRFFFYYAWKSILSGIIPALGISDGLSSKTK